MKKYVIIMLIFIFLIIGLNIRAHERRELYIQTINEISSIYGLNKDDNINKEEAIRLIKDTLENTNSYIPKIIEVDSEDDESYIIHAYDIIYHEGEGSHTATVGWYRVNKKTGTISDIIN